MVFYAILLKNILYKITVLIILYRIINQISISFFFPFIAFSINLKSYLSFKINSTLSLELKINPFFLIFNSTFLSLFDPILNNSNFSD